MTAAGDADELDQPASVALPRAVRSHLEFVMREKIHIVAAAGAVADDVAAAGVVAVVVVVVAVPIAVWPGPHTARARRAQIRRLTRKYPQTFPESPSGG